MILVGHQPEYLPYLGYFLKVARADHFMLVDHVQYARRDYQNRNYIRNRTGKILLTVPVLNKGNFEAAFHDIPINGKEPWARKHWRSIHFSYKDAPHWEPYGPALETVYRRPWEKLADLNIHLIRMMMDWLGLRMPVTLSSQHHLQMKKTEMLVEMCRAVGADAYISGQGARDYVEPEVLARAGIRHFFCRFHQPEYPQAASPFIPNLSVLDLLFNCGEGAREILDRAVALSSLEP
jgi:hypothetical protein